MPQGAWCSAIKYRCCPCCRWDYAADERDTEIAELKKRLVEQDRKHKEMASKTAEDVKIMTVELQVRIGQCPLADQRSVRQRSLPNTKIV